MKIAITGGTGFVGRHLADLLIALGHEVVLVARGAGGRGERARELPGSRFVQSDLSDPAPLVEAFADCRGVAHLAGINRELGAQTYARVHVEGTRNVVEAARRAGAGKVLLLSFLRARPACGSPYHESKWEAEEIVRGSGLDHTVLKAGVIYGRGDHLLDHLSHGLHTFPIFPLVGMRPRSFRPVAVEDVARIIRASLVDGRLSRRTVRVIGPEEMSFRAGLERVARVLGKRPLIFPCPVPIHRLLARLFEWSMAVPLVSLAQVRMLAEGIVEAAPPCGDPDPDLRPQNLFTDDRIWEGLPEPGGFRLRDLRCASR